MYITITLKQIIILIAFMQHVHVVIQFFISAPGALGICFNDHPEHGLRSRMSNGGRATNINLYNLISYIDDGIYIYILYIMIISI